MIIIAKGRASDIVVMLYSSLEIKFDSVNIDGYEKDIKNWQDLDKLEKWCNKYSVYEAYITGNKLILEETYHHEKEFIRSVEVLL